MRYSVQAISILLAFVGIASANPLVERQDDGSTIIRCGPPLYVPPVPSAVVETSLQRRVGNAESHWQMKSCAFLLRTEMIKSRTTARTWTWSISLSEVVRRRIE
ncbi:hypothetical protein L218DRAFT_950384 [Marasmius fiardii PR-910]|nr:hypothetical protein L218DRAFT_950384 [Marasmius fiardii PR-910]